MSKRWNYTGDVNLEYGGGIFYRDTGNHDSCEAVKITPLSDGGAPDNLYCVEVGSYYFGSYMNAALDCIGYEGKRDNLAKIPLIDRVAACDAYAGLDGPDLYYVRIGKPEQARAWIKENEDPNYVLRSNASLRNFVKREFLK